MRGWNIQEYSQLWHKWNKKKKASRMQDQDIIQLVGKNPTMCIAPCSEKAYDQGEERLG